MSEFFLTGNIYLCFVYVWPQYDVNFSSSPVCCFLHSQVEHIFRQWLLRSQLGPSKVKATDSASAAYADSTWNCRRKSVIFTSRAPCDCSTHEHCYLAILQRWCASSKLHEQIEAGRPVASIQVIDMSLLITDVMKFLAWDNTTWLSSPTEHIAW